MIALATSGEKPSSQRNAIPDFLDPPQSEFGISRARKKLQTAFANQFAQPENTSSKRKYGHDSPLEKNIVAEFSRLEVMCFGFSRDLKFVVVHELDLF
jgi:hypothetical protein